MDSFLIILALGLTVADKLDRSYLPPPGSKYAGGSPGSIDLPLEYPKITATSDQELNQNKGFQSTPKLSVINNSQFNFGKPLYTQFTENAEMSNGIRANGINQSPTNKYKNIENRAITNISDYLKTQTEKNPYENVKKELNFQDQEVISDPKNISNHMDYTPVLRTGQDSNESSLEAESSYRGLLIKKPGNSFEEIEETVYGKDRFGIKAPFENNMYKDSTSYGTQAMYRPDTIYTEFNRDSSAPISSTKLIQPESYSPYLNSNKNSLIMYPNDVHSQTSSIYPDLGNTSTNKPFSTYKNNDSLLTKTFQVMNVSPPVKQNQVDTILNYKRPERPQAEADRNAYILKYEHFITPEGYSYSYDTSNGIHADENATATNGVKAKGSYSYTDDDGKVYTVKYTADENGFRPIGDHLPTPPPIPIEIQAALNQIAHDIETGNLDDGSYDEKKYGYEKYQGKLDRSNPRLQDSIVISKNIQDSNDFKKKPEVTGKKQNEGMNNQVEIQTTERYSSTRPTNVIPDSIDNRDSMTIPYSKNKQYPENINQRIQDRQRQKVTINQDNARRPDITFNVDRKELDIDKTNEFNPTYEFLNNDDSGQKITSTNFNRYLPETDLNKFSYRIVPKISETSAYTKNMKIGQINKSSDGDVNNLYTVQNLNQREDNTSNDKSETIRRPNVQNNVKVTALSDSKVSYPTTATEQSFDGLVNSNLKHNEYNGYQYTSLDKNSTPNLNQYSTDDIEYIPILRTNYDGNINTNLNFSFDLPSTTDNTKTSTDKYSDTYSTYGDEESTTRYEFTPNYYSENTPLTNYDTEGIIGTRPSIELDQTKIYNQEYTQNRDENGSSVTSKTLIRPSQKFEYTQLQEYTTPISIGKASYDGVNMNFLVNKGNSYDRILPTELNKQNTSNKNKNVFMGYTYDKPSSYINQTIYRENNPSIFSQSDNSGNKDAIYLNNRYNFNNQNDRLSPGKDFKESDETNYYINDYNKVPNYNLFENTKYIDQSSKGFPGSKERIFVDTQYTGENVASNKPVVIQSDKPTTLATSDFIVYNPKAKDINIVGSEYIRPTESNQYSNDAEDQIAKRPINKDNGIFDRSRHIGDNRSKVDTNERVIGEDFSGPKRLQGFNPATGYNY